MLEAGAVLRSNLLDAKVMMKLKNPCISFQKVYLSIDILSLLINELTCAIIESPEKEHIKLIILSFKFIERVELAISLQPLVNSILPKNNE